MAMETARSRMIMRVSMAKFTGALMNDWYAKRWWIAPGRALGGHSDAPMAENGQSPRMLPSGPYVILVKLKNAIARNDARMANTEIFLSINGIPCIIAFSLSDGASCRQPIRWRTPLRRRRRLGSRGHRKTGRGLRRQRG